VFHADDGKEQPLEMRIHNRQIRLFAFLWLFLLCLLCAGISASQSQRHIPQRDLDALVNRGGAYHSLGDGKVEYTNPEAGLKEILDLNKPDEARIRDWAAVHNIPILEIDPNLIDTSQYRGWYNYWATVPVTNGLGFPTIVGDMNHNGQTEIYGVYYDTLQSQYQTRIYEVDDSAGVFLRHIYQGQIGISRQIADVDRNSLNEVVFSYGGVIRGYEQPSPNSLPTTLLFSFDQFYNGWVLPISGIFVGDLDGDSLTDFLYHGTAPDPQDTNTVIAYVFVAEYNQAHHEFERAWSIPVLQNLGASGISVGDFDGNSHMDFVTSMPTGRVFVSENTGDNSYGVVWQDSLPYVNFNYHGKGDIDNDGMVEFFVGATLGDGEWTVVLKSNGVHSYTPNFIFHLLSNSFFSSPIHTTIDVDGDGQLELVILAGPDLYVFGRVSNTYRLKYYRSLQNPDGVTFYDFNHDGRIDYLVTRRFEVHSQLHLEGNIFVASPMVAVNRTSTFHQSSLVTDLSSYPNPFNGSSVIRFRLLSKQHVVVEVADMTGRTVKRLIDRELSSGWHSIPWAATDQASGIYFCRMTSSVGTQTIKLLLLR
jgi:hypothetical protein